ncbi:MAG TPA: hypothetical protein VIA18_12420, partial [Polyangia bacterium]|nr:hypothetical protein [Polyangia bacterium]
GFADKTVAIDPAAAHKVVVTLEHAHKAAHVATSAPGVKEAAPGATKSTAPTKLAAATAKPVVGKPAGAHANGNEAPLDPYGATPTKPAASGKSSAPAKTAAKSAAAAKPSDALSALVERTAQQAESGVHRLGDFYRGVAADDGDRSDWYVQLPVAQCYTFFGEGGDGVKALYLYLWGPNGKRVKDNRESTPHTRMTYCTTVAGLYHFQAKVDDGKGEYRVGIYNTH